MFCWSLADSRHQRLDALLVQTLIDKLGGVGKNINLIAGFFESCAQQLTTDFTFVEFASINFPPMAVASSVSLCGGESRSVIRVVASPSLAVACWSVRAKSLGLYLRRFPEGNLDLIRPIA